jgi:hypothetical protein
MNSENLARQCSGELSMEAIALEILKILTLDIELWPFTFCIGH